MTPLHIASPFGFGTMLNRMLYAALRLMLSAPKGLYAWSTKTHHQVFYSRPKTRPGLALQGFARTLFVRVLRLRYAPLRMTAVGGVSAEVNLRVLMKMRTEK